MRVLCKDDFVLISDVTMHFLLTTVFDLITSVVLRLEYKYDFVAIKLNLLVFWFDY